MRDLSVIVAFSRDHYIIVVPEFVLNSYNERFRPQNQQISSFLIHQQVSSHLLFRLLYENYIYTWDGFCFDFRNERNEILVLRVIFFFRQTAN